MIATDLMHLRWTLQYDLVPCGSFHNDTARNSDRKDRGEDKNRYSSM